MSDYVCILLLLPLGFLFHIIVYEYKNKKVNFDIKLSTDKNAKE